MDGGGGTTYLSTMVMMHSQYNMDFSLEYRRCAGAHFGTLKIYNLWLSYLVIWKFVLIDPFYLRLLAKIYFADRWSILELVQFHLTFRTTLGPHI